MFTVTSIFSIIVATSVTTTTTTSSGGDSSSSTAAAVTTTEKIITAASTNNNLHFLLYILKITLCWYADISDCHCYRKGVNVIFIHIFVSCFIWISLVLGSARARTACLSQVEEVLETHSA